MHKISFDHPCYLDQPQTFLPRDMAPSASRQPERNFGTTNGWLSWGGWACQVLRQVLYKGHFGTIQKDTEEILSFVQNIQDILYYHFKFQG